MEKYIAPDRKRISYGMMNFADIRCPMLEKLNPLTL